jgi:predicted nucleotidyltransferase
MVRLHQDYREFIKLLNESGVEYLVIGAFALAFHGLPRFTGDIDFWVNSSIENSKKVYNCIKDFGFPMGKITETDFNSDDLIFQIGYPPVRIDILTAVSGLDFNNSFKNKKIKRSGTLKINFLSIDDLIKNKKASGRKKDLVDLDVIRKHK